MNKIYKIQEKMLMRIAEIEKNEIVRDIPINWERIHMISCAKIGQILALKRGVDVELAAIACTTHDYGRIVTGKHKDHAAACYEPLKEFLAECGCFSEEEIEMLALAGKNHSSKDVVGTPLEEIVKDADVLDCFQYGIPLEREEQKKRLDKIIVEISR